MKRIIWLVAIATVICFDPARAQQSRTAEMPRAVLPHDSTVLRIIKQRVEEQRSKGIVIGLLEPDGRTRIVAYGDGGAGRPPLDGNTVFEIGSITKVFTGILLADMVSKGEVKLDDPVQKYLPDGVRMPERNGATITLAHLAEQNSGLPRIPLNMKPKDAANPYSDYTVAQLYEFLSSYQLPRAPGERYEYSNLAVGLLGHVLALRAGQSYEDLVRTRILEPLAMAHTAITLTPPMRAHLALGHNMRGEVVANWDLPTLAGAGALRSNAHDMLKFLAANINTADGPLGAALALAQRERAPAGSPAMRIGLNWHRLHAGADTIVWHNGGTGGYRTFAGFLPRKRAAVVVLTNTGGQGADDIGFHLLNSSLPLAPAPAAIKQRTAIELTESVLQRYVGTYEFTPQFSIEVTREGSTLWGQATQQPRFRLWPEAETEFFLKEVDAQITFVVDAQGAVTGMVLHQNGQRPTARKVK